MATSRLPDGEYRSIYDIDGAALAASGIRLLLADLDNTLVPYSVPEPTDSVRAWAAGLEQCGIRLFVLSNNRSGRRAKYFCSALGVPYISHAGKPRKKNFLRAMKQMGAEPAQTVMVGDQFFTDGLGGKCAGVSVILVQPIDMRSNPFRALRYLLEWPFRAALHRKREGVMKC